MKMAEGFSDLYDKVLKDDYTPMRKRLTEYLRGPKQYYQYMRLVMGTEYCAPLSARLVVAATGPAREKTCKSKFRLTSFAHGVKRTRGQEFCVSTEGTQESGKRKENTLSAGLSALRVFYYI
jgi:hypothetical protein